MDWRITLDHCFPLPRSVYRRSSNSVEMPVQAHTLLRQEGPRLLDAR
jgi:hypothetical protein